MTGETIGVWMAIGGLALAVGTNLVQLGRVLERQKVHGEEILRQREDIADLADGHSESKAIFEALKGELNGIRSVLQAWSSRMEEWIKRFDRHIERGD